MENEYKKTNREKKREFKMGLFWCNCDLSIVGVSRKCKICKRRITSKKK